ncbi:MAG TPA: hypothetical protein VFF04_01120 [Candidatus Babeliales bacterium]|nr:hypothetical protein [Candidatus Babeliales bacterium]
MNLKKIILLVLGLLPIAMNAHDGRGRGHHHKMHCHGQAWCEKWKRRGQAAGGEGAAAAPRRCKGGMCPRRAGGQGGRRMHGAMWMKRKKGHDYLKSFLQKLATEDYDGAEDILNKMKSDADVKDEEPIEDMENVLNMLSDLQEDLGEEGVELEEES